MKMELNAKQKETIAIQLQNRGIETPDLKIALTSEIESKIAAKMAEGESFWRALKSTFNSYGAFGIEKIQHGHYRQLQQNQASQMLGFLTTHIFSKYTAIAVLFSSIFIAAKDLIQNSLLSEGNALLFSLALLAIWTLSLLYTMGIKFLKSGLFKMSGFVYIAPVLLPFVGMYGGQLFSIGGLGTYAFAVSSIMFIYIFTWGFVARQKKQLVETYGLDS